MTDNHDYNRPSKGTTEWHVPINENFETLDRDVEIRDTEGTIRDYDPKAGAKFFATDTERVFIGDGQHWNELASPGLDPTLESISNEIADASIQTAWDGLVVPVAHDLGMADAIDPTATSEPVQQAIDTIGHKRGGTILLPRGTVEEDSAIRGWQFKRIIGWGLRRSGQTGASEIRFTDHASSGFVQNPKLDRDGRYSYLDGFVIHGDDASKRQPDTHAIDLSEAHISAMNMGRATFSEWPTPVLNFDPFHPFGFSWDWIQRIGGTAGDFLYFGTGGPNGNVRAIQDRGAGGTTLTIAPGAGATLDIGGIETISEVDHCIDSRGGRLRVHDVHFEGADSTSWVVREQGGRSSRYNNVYVVSRSVDELVNLGFRPRNVYIGFTSAVGGATIRNNHVVIESPPSGPIFYQGPRSNVDNVTDSTAEQVWSLSDMKLVDPVSSGTVLSRTGQSPAARVPGVGTASETIRPTLQTLSPVTGVGASHAIESYFEWDGAAGRWVLVLTWQTDPGTDVEFAYEVVTKGVG